MLHDFSEISNIDDSRFCLTSSFIIALQSVMNVQDIIIELKVLLILTGSLAVNSYNSKQAEVKK